MLHADVGTTKPAQLRAICDWKDNSAWVEFQEKYDPLLLRCCACLGLKGDDVDEVRQETWIEVAQRMEKFVYDPQRGTFRGWLWRMCHHKALNFLIRRERESMFHFDERDESVRRRHDSVDVNGYLEACAADGLAADQEGNLALSGLFREAEEIQATVRRHVEPQTWEAFWLFQVMFWTAEETADHLQMSHAAVYKANQRVLKRLQAEGRRRAPGATNRGELRTGG
jgi:RNA polymerase sigma factor (sigma-70 family)